jgi:hypothetical protein
MKLDDEECLDIILSYAKDSRMMHYSVIARHDSAEAISVGQKIATHLSGARNDKKGLSYAKGSE